MKYVPKLGRVNQGIAFLDETYGRETWLEKIDTDVLDVHVPSICVLGQVDPTLGYYGRMHEVEQNGGDSSAWAWNHGFRAVTPAGSEPLTKLWLSRIDELRAE